MLSARVAVVLGLCLGLALVVSVVAAVAWAADEPTAPQPQMVRFVSHFIAFTPKDPAILSVDLGGGPPGFLRWAVPWIMAGPRRTAPGPDGHLLYKPLGDVEPELGPLDAFEGRDPGAVRDLVTRLDDRWNYHILTLSGSGRMGDMLYACGFMGPMRLGTGGGLELGPAYTATFEIVRIVRVDRAIADGHVLVQTLDCIRDPRGVAGCGGETAASWRALGAPYLEGGQSAVMGPYTNAVGEKLFPDVLWPGLICAQTVELGAWETRQGPKQN